MSSNQGAKFWDRIADNYAKKPIADESAYAHKLKITQSYLRPDMNLLEIGCGTGSTSLTHAPFVKHILATDISQKMVDIANRKKEEGKVDNVDFEKASVDEMRIADGSVDCVLGLSILHLIENRDEVVRKVHTWLKPGGLFVTSTMCVADMGAGSKLIKVFAPIGQFFGLIPPFYSFSKEDLKKSFRDAGFGIEYEWQPKNDDGRPKNDAAVFIIGKKTDE